MHRFIVFCVFILLTQCAVLDARAQDVTTLRLEANRALDRGDYTLAERRADEMLKASDDAVVKRAVGDIYLRAGKPKKALEQFEAYLETAPGQLPFLWQRGIAQYFVGDFKGGVKQFEVHRTVNPNDVENAAWHFLCLAKADSFEKAGQMVLPAPGDRRLPMTEVQQMLSSGDTQSVIDKIEAQTGPANKREAEFYGYFYLGLYADAKGNRETALDWMQKSAKEAPRGYMGDVARVYAKFLAEQQKVNK